MDNKNFGLNLNEVSNILFESAAEALVVADPEGIIQIINPRTSEMFGYAREELIGQPVEVLIPRALKARHEKHRENYNKAPAKRSMGIGMDLVAKRKDDSLFPVEVSLNHFKVDGQMMVMALISDVTERKKMDVALKEMNAELEQKVAERTRDLKESQRLYSIISRNFPNGTINVFDENLRYVFIEGMEMYRLGIDGSKLVGTSYLERLDPEIRDEIQEQLMAVFNGENQSFEINFKGRTYMINAVGLPDESGKIRQILVVEQNITSLKKAESDIREALEKEKQLSELKSRFVSMASHEFRTPLTTVLSSLSLLNKYIDAGGNKEKEQKHIHRIRSSVHHLTNILNDFLSIDKLEEGRMDVNLSKFDLATFIEEVGEEMQEMTKEGQQVKVHYEGSEEIFSDKNILRNILHNLISNAIKYSPEGNPIYVFCKEQNGALTISVKDEGIGIPETEQNHLFERFFRARNALNIQGTGLGLSIIKKYTDLLKGQVNFKSSEGKGTTFTVIFPPNKFDYEKNIDN